LAQQIGVWSLNFVQNMHLFGKAKAKPSATDTIQRLRDTLDLLDKREKYLQKKADNEMVEARKNAQKNKRGLCNS